MALIMGKAGLQGGSRCSKLLGLISKTIDRSYDGFTINCNLPGKKVGLLAMFLNRSQKTRLELEKVKTLKDVRP